MTMKIERFIGQDPNKLRTERGKSLIGLLKNNAESYVKHLENKLYALKAEREAHTDVAPTNMMDTSASTITPEQAADWFKTDVKLSISIFQQEQAFKIAQERYAEWFDESRED